MASGRTISIHLSFTKHVAENPEYEFARVSRGELRMSDDLDHVIQSIGRFPIEHDVRIAFDRVLLHGGCYKDEVRRKALEEFETFGKIVLSNDRPAKPYFVRRFARAAEALASAMDTQAA